MGIFITCANTGTQLGDCAHSKILYNRNIDYEDIELGDDLLRDLKFLFLSNKPVRFKKRLYIILIAETRSKKNSRSGF